MTALKCRDVPHVLYDADDFVHSKTVQDLRYYHRIIFPYANDTNRLNRLSLCKRLKKYIRAPKLYLENQKNGCYFDAFLVAILHDFRAYAWLDRQFFRKRFASHQRIQSQIQQLLMHIYTYLYRPQHRELVRYVQPSTKKTKYMRGLFQRYTQKYTSLSDDIDWICSQEEPGEIASLLLDIFEVKPDVAVMERTPTGKWRRQKVYFSGVPVHSFTLLENNTRRVNVQDVLVNPDFRVISAPLLFIPIFRGVGDDRQTRQRKDFTRVLMPRQVHLLDKSTLIISSIIVHMGSSLDHGHFVTYMYANAQNEWYLADDLSDNYEKVYMDRALETHVQKNAIAIVYIRV